MVLLSISEFSEMCQLSSQTLRFYHSEGLLVPAEVDDRTGYRSYTLDQVETAMMVMVLRGTGMSVKRVRRALDEPDAAPSLLEEHSRALRLRRGAEDEALREAHEFVHARPQVERRRSEAATVVSVLLRPSPTGASSHDYDWEHVRTAATAAVREVTDAVTSLGGAVSGTPWRSWAIETPEQKMYNLTAEGPHWLVKVPVRDDAALEGLPAHMEVQDFPAREEVCLSLPGQTTTAKYATVVSRLVAHHTEDAFVDITRTRDVLHDDRVESRAPLRPLDEGTDT